MPCDLLDLWMSGDLHLEEQLCAEGNTFIEARASTFSPIRQLQRFISADASQHWLS
jgi:hypothetical protein